MKPTLAALIACAFALAACGSGSAPAPCSGGAHPARSAPWPTYHGDLARTGTAELGPRSARARCLWATRVDGAVYAEPLVARGLVIAATENDTLYALDARTGAVRWRTHLGAPVPGGSLPCGNIDPSGITSTPAVDTRSGVVHAVDFLAPAHHQLVTLALASGRVLRRLPIDAPGADPTVEQQRGALAVAGGRVYVPYGGLYGDCGDYHGFVVSAPATGAGALAAYRVPAQRQAGLWAPSGPAIDAAGDLYVASGNGNSDSFDHGNTVIRLSPGLQETGFFAPPNAAALNVSDGDLGSVGPLLLPGGRLFTIGKDGVGYLVDATRPGGVGGEIARTQVCGSAFGGLAYAAGTVYVACTSGLRAVRLDGARLTVAWQGPTFHAGPPVVAGASVWTIDLDDGILEALAPATGSVQRRIAIGDAAHFATPAAAGGVLYVGGGGRVEAIG